MEKIYCKAKCKNCSNCLNSEKNSGLCWLHLKKVNEIIMNNNNRNYIDPIIMYAGSFNPIHYGHIQIAKEALNNSHLLGYSGEAKILFHPVARSQLGKPPFSLKHRVNMIKLAIKCYNNMKVLNLDEFSEKPRTHYDRFLEMQGRGIKINYWIIGSDTYTDEVFKRFELYKIIKEGVTLIVSKRCTYPITNINIGSDGQPISALNNKNLNKNIIFLKEPKVNNKISSTQIRTAMANGHNYIDLIPPSVIEYIHQNNLEKIYT